MDFTKLNKEQLSSHLESEILKIKDVKDIIRINFWWIFFELIKKILNDRLKSEKDKKKKILLKLTILTQLVNKTAKEVYNSQNEIDRKINEIKIDVINRYLEEHTIYAEDNKILLNNESDFEYYPEYSDNLFNKKVYQKKEFNENIFPKLSLENRGKSKSFKKSPSQKFVKNFISTTTPYNGILLWHGVGVGKTCAAISIAENFRNIVYQNDKKILVLTPSDTIQQNWKDEIFSIEKENNNVNSVNVQCTGLRYKNSLSNYEEKTNKQKILAVNKLINKYYEIMGYQKLTNEIEKYFNSLSDIVKPENIENRKIKYIKEKFSNRVIIMDEVHVTREGGTNKDDKKSRPYIEMICRYAENTKLILLTATPMYNISKEIIWLLNLLLWNDKQSPLEETHIFKKNGIDLQDYPEDTERISDGKHKLAIEYLIKKSRGYVSYIRGENPYIFPLKLNPEKSLTYTPSPKLKLESKKWVPLKETEKIKEDSMQFYKNSLSLWQFNELKKYLSNVDDEISGSMSSIKKSSFSRQPLQASNIVYPNPNFYIDDNPELKGELRGELGERLGLNNSFIYDSENDKYTYNKTSKIDLGSINSDNKGFLHLDYIQKYSIKFHSILKNILTCKGIAFVYSQFISHGIKPFALSLEENGFERYVLDGNTNNFLSKPIKQADKYCGYHKKYYRNLTESEKKNFRQAKYIYLDGKLKKKDLDQLVKSVKGQELDKDNEYINNDNGQHVMVILGSRVIEQGISFFGVREIHIMDPWHHLNMMEQASGRGIRQKSHFHLPVNMRNVTQYLHIAALPKSLENLFQETSDERIYRNAYFKKNKMTEIERILKEYAIDCSLNKYANMFSQSNYPDTFNIENSKGKIINNVNIFDKDGSLKCDFKNCDYKCDWENIDPDYTVNTDTFSKEFMLDSVENVKEFVKLLFIDEYVFSLESIIRIIKSDYDSRTTNEYIYIALDEIIKNKEIVQDMYNRKGYIIYREGSYIFQPLEINNTNLLYYDRIHPLSIKNYSVKLDNTKQLNQIVKVKSKIKFKSLNLKKKKKEGLDEDKIKIFEDIKKILDYENTKKYIYKDYSNYPKTANPNLPTQDQLIKIYQYYKIDRFSDIYKEVLISNILINIINNNNSPTDYLDQLILDYYDNNAILRYKRDVVRDETTKEYNEGYPFFYRLVMNDKSQKFLEFNKELNNFTEAISLSEEEEEKFTLKEKDFIHADNNSKIFGFLSKYPESLFYVVNNIGYQDEYNKTGEIKKKKQRKGAKCGHGRNVTSVVEIGRTINNVYGVDFYKSKPKTRMKQTKVFKGKSLCQELEFALRFKQLSRTKSDSSKNIIWFYKTEEIFK